ncbi:hypothetical protein AB0L40_09400 [Patulibacter sp. NPDC049589]|uniref:hypothetical protein n=1 Tax=Patulibacter sp. NPDC049589 TaxID=3154731 RepID=UPI003421DAD1
MATPTTRTSGSRLPASAPLQSILEEISVPMDVMKEARRRRDLVLEIAREHPSVRGRWSSGSVAYGTANSPLEDADGGLKMNRRLADMRQFGPDAPGLGLGPGPLMEEIGYFVLVRLRDRHYPKATVDVSGKRAIKFEFHDTVDLDSAGPVDPYVDVVLGLARPEGARGLWIPNRKAPGGWDLADPAGHLQAMNGGTDKPLRVLRAHVVRLSKRTVKHDEHPVACSWNLCALALELVDDADLELPEAFARFLEGASRLILDAPTPDPSPVVAPIELPAGIPASLASLRLEQKASSARAAAAALTAGGARAHYAELFGPEVASIRSRERTDYLRRLGKGTPLAAAPSIVSAPSEAHKPTRSDGAPPQAW